MEKYSILYKSTKIGVLEINEKGQYKYTPDLTAVEKVKNDVSLIHDMLESSDWRDPIPFFKNRIENAKRFSDVEIGYHTDNFMMIKEELA